MDTPIPIRLNTEETASLTILLVHDNGHLEAQSSPEFRDSFSYILKSSLLEAERQIDIKEVKDVEDTRRKGPLLKQNNTTKPNQTKTKDRQTMKNKTKQNKQTKKKTNNT